MKHKGNGPVTLSLRLDFRPDMVHGIDGYCGLICALKSDSVWIRHVRAGQGAATPEPHVRPLVLAWHPNVR